jgi:hypothetical protein
VLKKFRKTGKNFFLQLIDFIIVILVSTLPVIGINSLKNGVYILQPPVTGHIG